MKLRQVCEKYSIEETVYTENKQLLKLVSYWLSENLKIIVEPLRDTIKKLGKKVSTLEQTMTTLKKQSSTSSSKRESADKKGGTVFVTHYRNCVLFHRDTYQIRSILKSHKFSWKPEEKGWVRQKPVQLGKIFEEIKQNFPLVEFQESEQDGDLL